MAQPSKISVAILLVKNQGSTTMNVLILLLSLYVVEAALKCPKNTTLNWDDVMETFYAAKVQVLSVGAKGDQYHNAYEYIIDYPMFYFTRRTMYHTRRNVPIIIRIDQRCGPPLTKSKFYAIGYYWHNAILFLRPFEDLSNEEKRLLDSKPSKEFA
ncbi:hypothetical protein Y032_0598g456 [Ancylostoma ceylanicum]|uniref:Uncharacterized protein n=1 Tax=Ancylostoma ceylanicum TaxID=53326 RepID=A0A016WLR3_9BILA|nr:hypothetical protein Y032_0598g456 [Ancylostoma ceylanicum]